jgi:hypothetical protein
MPPPAKTPRPFGKRRVGSENAASVRKTPRRFGKRRVGSENAARFERHLEAYG